MSDGYLVVIIAIAVLGLLSATRIITDYRRDVHRFQAGLEVAEKQRPARPRIVKDDKDTKT